MAINHAVISGNITNAPRKLGTQDNPGLSFSVAVNVPVRKDGKWETEPLFVDCAMFGNRCVKLSEILCKGMSVTVDGSLKPNRYTNKDGVLVNTFSLMVKDIQLPPANREGSVNSNESIPF